MPKPTLYSLMPREYREVLEEQFVNPLKDLGFEWTSYSASHTPEFGTHILVFHHNGKTEYRTDWVKTICTKDDDNQPYSTHSLYLGTLFLYIPYLP